MMKKITCFSLFMIFFLPLCSSGQNESVDLDVISKIKQEGMQNTDIDELAFWMSDYSGPRLTASEGWDRGAEWAKRKLEEYGLQDVRIEIARAWDRGGWNNRKTYAAMTAPYYVNFTANPVAWTGSTEGVVKSEAILLDINDESDFDRFKGKLRSKIILIPNNAMDEAVFTLMMSRRSESHRYSDQELKELTMAVP